MSSINMNIIGISGLDNIINFKKSNLKGLSDKEYYIVQGLDSSAAIVNSSGVVAAAAQERFNRIKATCQFPVDAINYCLSEAKLNYKNVDYIAHSFSYDPYKPFFMNSDEYYKKLFHDVYSKEALIKNIKKFIPTFNWGDKIINVEHHLAHAASTFYLSGFEDSLILISDAMGEIFSTSIAIGNKKGIHIIKQIPTINSLGIFYSLFTLYLGFYMNSDEYKIMGLAPYGDPYKYYKKVMDLVVLEKDGTVSIPILTINKTLIEKETYRGSINKLIDIFGETRKPESEISQDHKDIAAALQNVLQTCLNHILTYFKKETDQKNLCMAGGVALNCTANGVILKSKMFDDVFIQPASGDDGSALGAALYVQHLHNQTLKISKINVPSWGPQFKNEDIKILISEYNDLRFEYYENFNQIIKIASKLLFEGNIISWFQGRMEFGPRALGFRSILADPRDAEMREKLNRIVKKREAFRPFAPAVTFEKANKYFEIDNKEVNYQQMLFVTKVRKDFQKLMPAVTHVDGSARVQTVKKEDNFRFWSLLNEYEKLSGLPILLNTSFNVRSQPIVCSPRDALDTFKTIKIKALVIENYIIYKGV